MFCTRSFSARLAVVAALACSAAVAQDAPAIDQFMVESTLTLDKIGFATTTLGIPANILASITSGALEIRQIVTYVPSTKIMRVRHVLVQAKAPNPTPANTQVGTAEDYTAAIREIVGGTNPNTLTFIGTVDAYASDSPFAIRTGMPFIFSVGYEAGTPTKFNTIQLLVPGRASSYAASSTGTLTFAGAGTGGSTDLKADAGKDFTTVSSEISLDGTGSSSASNSALTYKWRVVKGSANILDPTAAKPRVQLAENFATYTFELTVTDAAGKTATATVNVMYSGRF